MFGGFYTIAISIMDLHILYDGVRLENQKNEDLKWLKSLGISNAKHMVFKTFLRKIKNIFSKDLVAKQDLKRVINDEITYALN